MFLRKCPYCENLNEVNVSRISRKCCPRCLFWGNKLRCKHKLSKVDRINMVNYLTSIPQCCNNCHSKENLTIDRIKSSLDGGKYETNNIQILCYTCNCCIKTKYSSIEEAQKSHTEKKCLNCKKTFPLNENYWHKNSYKSKYRAVTISEYRAFCKDCQQWRDRNRVKITCLNCKKETGGAKKTAKFCSISCSRKYVG